MTAKKKKHGGLGKDHFLLKQPVCEDGHPNRARSPSPEKITALILQTSLLPQESKWNPGSLRKERWGRVEGHGTWGKGWDGSRGARLTAGQCQAGSSSRPIPGDSHGALFAG